MHVPLFYLDKIGRHVLQRSHFMFLFAAAFVLSAAFRTSSYAQTEKPQEPQTPAATASSESSPRQDPAIHLVPEGALARLSLQTRLSTKINEVGDQITAVLYEAVRSSDGRTLIPRGTEFTGRVTQIQAAGRLQKQATMTIVFESMQMSYGAEKISTIVTAIDDYANDEKYRAKDDEGKVGGGHSGKSTAGNTGAGAGIGAIGGGIIAAAGGGWGGLAAATGIGAVGGVLMTKGNDLKLEAGTVLRIRFEREVRLPALE